MERHLVGPRFIDLLDDVDFTVVGPVWPYRPKCGPRAADATGHVCNVGDEQTVRVGFAGTEPD